MRSKSFKSFFYEVSGLTELAEDVRTQEMAKLIEKWKNLIKNYQQPHRSLAEEYRKLHHLKLQVKWIKKTLNSRKKILFMGCMDF